MGLGVSPFVAAPVVRVDPLSDRGIALVASWVSEPECAWVHIRCPRSVFPVSHSDHLLPQGQGEQSFVKSVTKLMDACTKHNIPWSFEAPARSSVWEHAPFCSLKRSTTQANMCQFGHVFRSPILVASSRRGVFARLDKKCDHAHPSTFQKVGAVPFERRRCEAFAQCIADALGVPEFVPKTPAKQAAQVLTGLQPRKLPFRVLPEFKCIMKVASHVLPPLDAKQCTKADWCAQGICVPQGSKLLRPSFSDHGEGMEKAGLHAPHADDVLASPVPNLDLKKATVMS